MDLNLAWELLVLVLVGLCFYTYVKGEKWKNIAKERRAQLIKAGIEPYMAEADQTFVVVNSKDEK